MSRSSSCVCFLLGVAVLLKSTTLVVFYVLFSVLLEQLGALVAVWYSAGFAIGRLRVRISAWATSHQGLLSLPSLSGSVNEYQLQLGRHMQVWLIPIADERVGVQVKLWNPSKTRAIPERFCGGDSLRRGAISSVCTFLYLYHNWMWYADVMMMMMHLRVS